MDRYATLATEGFWPVLVFGDLGTSEFELVEIRSPGTPLPTQWGTQRFLGVLAMQAGKPKVAFAVPLEDREVEAVATAYSRYLQSKCFEAAAHLSPFAPALNTTTTPQ